MAVPRHSNSKSSSGKKTKSWMAGQFRTSPAMTTRYATRRSSDRLMHRYQLRSIGECRLHLDVMNHLGDAIHHLIARKHVSARLHQLGNGLAVARAFENEIGDQRHAFRMIELDAAVEAAARYHRSHGNQQLVLFTWGKMHATRSTRFNSPTGAAATSRAGHPSP